MQLRDYQIDLIERTREAMRSHRNVLLQSATGSGKTALTVHMMKTAAERGKTAMFIVHQSELLHQTSKALWEQKLEHGMIAPGKRRSYMPVQVASVQTLVRRLDTYGCPDLIVIDECMTGGTQINTDSGPKRIDQVSSGDRVMCYDGDKVKFSSVSDTWCSGERDIFEVNHGDGGVIRCTGNHRVWTDSGWKRVDSLSSGDLLLTAHAGAEKRCGATSGGGKENTFSATRSKDESWRIGSACTKNLSPVFLGAPAGVEEPFEQNTAKALSSSFETKVARNTTNTLKGTQGGVRGGMHSSPESKSLQSSGRCSETHRSYTPITHRPPLACPSIMVSTRKRGQNTKPIFYSSSEGRSSPGRIRDMGRCTIGSSAGARNLWLKYMEWWLRKGERLSPKNGLMNLEVSVSPGGYAMTDHVQVGAHASTPRGSQIENSTLSGTGYAKNMEMHMWYLVGQITKKYQSLLTHSAPSFQSLKSTSQNACNTRWSRIESVRKTGEVEKVYDITVPETGNFFANGVLVHNCHRAAARTYQRVIEAYPGARVVGLTATPQRTDGKGLDDLFDTIVQGPSIRMLIDSGYLADYELVAPPVEVDMSTVKTKMGDYDKAQLEEAVDKPTITGDAVAHYKRFAQGKRCVVMCVSIKHAEHVAAQYDSCGVKAEVIEGSLANGERAAMLDRFRRAETQVICNCALMVEGIDIPSIEVIQWLRPTQSMIIWMQGNGRGLRPAPGKDKLLILDHVSNWRRHGIPDEDREWSLEGRPKGKRKAKDEDEAPGVQQCQHCFHVFAKGPSHCPACGEALPGNAKPELEVVEGELEKIDVDQVRRERKREQGRARTLRDLVELGIRRGMNKPAQWSAITMAARQGKKPTAAEFAEAKRVLAEVKAGSSTHEEAF